MCIFCLQCSLYSLYDKEAHLAHSVQIQIWNSTHYQGSGSICTGSRGTFAINSSSSRCSAVLSRHDVNTVVSDPSDLVLCD